jgi:hypothetical protein
MVGEAERVHLTLLELRTRCRGVHGGPDRPAARTDGRDNGGNRTTWAGHPEPGSSRWGLWHSPSSSRSPVDKGRARHELSPYEQQARRDHVRNYRGRMTGRLANVALLVVVPLAAASGLGMFLLGSGPVLAVAVLHGLVGLAVVVLVPWKSVVVRRGLKRARGTRLATSLALAAVVILALVTGVAHLGGVLVAGALTSLQLHVGAGIAALVLTLVHARQRRVRARRADLSRRALLRLGLLASAAGVIERSARRARTRR